MSAGERGTYPDFPLEIRLCLEELPMSERKQLQRLLSQGWISRREFVKRMTALGAAASLPAGMLARLPALCRGAFDSAGTG